MQLPNQSARRVAVCRSLAGLLILGAAALRLAYLAWYCPLDLAPDEAHYWDWSRHLDWSYYSKGPLVAYLIRAGCALAGHWSTLHTGGLAFAVRLPAVACGVLLLVSLYTLTLQVFRCETLALGVVAAALTVPLLAVGASIMTIDAPYTCCWGWALVLAHRAVFRGSGWAWPALGLAVGVGILAKYTMVLFVPSLALFLLTSPGHRRLLLRPGFWCMAGVSALCCLPILVWNVQHDWVTVRHVLRLAGLVRGAEEPARSGLRLDWLGPLVYVGGQCGVLLVFWFVVWAAAMMAHRPTVERDGGLRFLWWTSAPMFLVFLAFAFKTGGGELNWPVTAYLSGFVLAAGWLERQLCSPVGWYRRATFVNLSLACGLGLGVSVFVHRSDWFYPALTRLAGPPPADNAFAYPLRRLDPSCRLRGWRTLAAAVDAWRAELNAGGVDPVLASCSWNVPGELGVYCTGHPQAYSVGLALGDRHSQYDLWPNPIGQKEEFLRRTFLLVGIITPEVRKAFDEVGPTRVVIHREHGQPIACWIVTVCRGYRGFVLKQSDRF
jgi:4-amino-4-deoxy-L-arabinose transferase-like glycosyltransferase